MYYCSLTGGRTNTQEALRKMGNEQFSSQNGDRSGVPNFAIVVTDGGSNIQRDNVKNEANSLRSKGNVDYSKIRDALFIGFRKVIFSPCQMDFISISVNVAGIASSLVI